MTTIKRNDHKFDGNHRGYSLSQNEPTTYPESNRDWAGSLPEFAITIGSDLTHSRELDDFRCRRLIFGRFGQPGAVHVYSTDCNAGVRLRVQSYIPVLPLADGLAPAFAVVAQSLPYKADIYDLPVALPAGYSAVIAQPPTRLGSPVEDRLTGARSYPGPVIDTRTLVSGRCFIIVWSPKNQMGKYVLQVGHQWPTNWFYWLRTPLFWWRIRGWYGISRKRAYFAMALIVTLFATVFAFIRGRRS